GPIPMVGFGRNAGNLAMYIRQGRELLEVLAPGIEYAGLDRGLADMIEDEADFRTLPHHLDRIGYLMVQDADIEGEIVRRQQLQSGDEVGTDAKFGIGLVLDQAPHRAQGLVAAELIELDLDGLAALERQCRDHAGELPVRMR